MGKRIIGLLLALVLVLGGSICAWGQENQIIEAPQARIEQVNINMPEIAVYAVGVDLPDAKAAGGYLSQKKVELVDAQLFGDSGEGITFYLLLDISGSMPDAYFPRIKEGILALQQNLGERDKLVLSTFGEEIRLVADGSQSTPELAEKLNEITNTDQKTLLFEAIDRVAQLADKEQENKRKVLFVLSDGEDIAVGQKLSQEALATLGTTGLPVYALCIRDTARSNINSFGEFARTSGGELVTFGAEESSQVLSRLAETLDQYLCIRYLAPDNQVSNQKETFHLKLSEEKSITKEVMNARWIPDHQAPVISSAKQAGSRQLEITFSKPVVGIDHFPNYQVVRDGVHETIVGAAAQGTDKVILNMEEPLVNGTYEISTQNLTDSAMEKNPVEGSYSLTLTGIVLPTEAAAEPAEPVTVLVQPEKEEKPQGALLLLLVLIPLVVTIILFGVLSSRMKKNKQKESAGNEPGQPQPPAPAAVMPQVIAVPAPALAAGQKRIQVSILEKGTFSHDEEWRIARQIIVGRSQKCDYRISDELMGRTHFALEWADNGLFIRDLGSTNGTAVNGVRLQNKRKLTSGDTIYAGSTKLILRF